MAQINILLSNHYAANLNYLHRKDQYPLDMVVPDLKDRNFEKFDSYFQWEDRRLVRSITIRLDYVIRENGVGNYDTYWSKIE